MVHRQDGQGGATMRGTDEASRSLISRVGLGAGNPARHPLRRIRQIAGAAPARLGQALAALRTDFGLPRLRRGGRSGPAGSGFRSRSAPRGSRGRALTQDRPDPIVQGEPAQAEGPAALRATHRHSPGSTRQPTRGAVRTTAGIKASCEIRPARTTAQP
ncbi:MAG: hypothetical protein N2439_04820, partial [Anaerolineae bacterium]|nr:hypothetical protein [Anaerolineae bacterium]